MTILEYADYAVDARYDADVVVIGTGAGGAAAGAELAEAGLDVVFLEEGGYHPTSSFNPYVTHSVPRLYRDASATVITVEPNPSDASTATASTTTRARRTDSTGMVSGVA